MAFSNNYYYGFKDYVSVAERRRQAARELAKLNRKGRKTSPVAIEGRKIATTFWGKAWCDNLERYSDYASRLPRGRSYVRNGTVVDLQIGPGVVAALVSGSELYTVRIDVGSVARARWQSIRKDCSGAIDSAIELLQGRLSDPVMARLCDQKTGLFPSPADIGFSCSCPDWASMCKHVAAVLYGIGARLDHRPELLFTLRQVAHEELIAKAGASLSASATTTATAGKRLLAEQDLSAMFGIEIAASPASPAGSVAPPATLPARAKPKPTPEPTAVSVHIPKPASAAARIRAAKPRSTRALKRAIAKQLKELGREIQRSRKYR
jgi:uncharacterized Zn finger protein